MACNFQAKVSRKFTPLIRLRDEDVYINTIITIYNIAVYGAASEIFEEKRCRKLEKVLGHQRCSRLCDERRDFKKKRYKAE